MGGRPYIGAPPEAGPIWGGPCGGRPYIGGLLRRPALWRPRFGGVVWGSPGLWGSLWGLGGAEPHPKSLLAASPFVLLFIRSRSPQPPTPPRMWFWGLPAPGKCPEAAASTTTAGVEPTQPPPGGTVPAMGASQAAGPFFVAFWASPGDVGALFWVPRGDVGALSFSRGQVSVWLRRAPQRAAVILGGGFGGPERRKEDFGLPTPLIFQPPP